MENVTVMDLLGACGGRLLCGRPDEPIRHISIDSRHMKGQDLFVPIVGEKVDAHRFIEGAFAAGAAAALTSRHDQMEDVHPWIQVEDTKLALQRIGAWYRERMALPLIGVTGSVGKTTTREMIARALSAKYQVYQTPGNSNSQVGVPITMTEISSREEIGVIELGVSEPGEMHRISMVAKVNQAVMTNIGIAHIGQLGSQAGICQEKLHIQDGMAPGGILYVNGDDPILREVSPKAGCRRITYGTDPAWDYQARDLTLQDGCFSFTAVCREDGEQVRVRLSAPGRHMVDNAIAALAIARENGVPMVKAAQMLEQFGGLRGRQEIHHVRGITVIDDSYNASPDSMKAGLQVLMDMPRTGRSFAVLGDMKELGPEALRHHREIGEFLAGKGVDVVLLYGELAAEIGRPLAMDQRADVLCFQDKEELTTWLEGRLLPGDVLLVKGSNSMGLGTVVSTLLKGRE